jgi:hypothetical protein
MGPEPDVGRSTDGSQYVVSCARNAAALHQVNEAVRIFELFQVQTHGDDDDGRTPAQTSSDAAHRRRR